MFKTKEELDDAINSYFDVTPKDEWTWTGLALHLNTNRQTLINYKEREEFVDSIEKGLARVENGYEIDLKKHGRTGTIFALKNFDWKDKTETDVTSGGKEVQAIVGMTIKNDATRIPDEEPKTATSGELLDR